MDGLVGYCAHLRGGEWGGVCDSDGSQSAAFSVPLARPGSLVTPRRVYCSRATVSGQSQVRICAYPHSLVNNVPSISSATEGWHRLGGRESGTATSVHYCTLLVGLVISSPHCRLNVCTAQS